MRNIFKTPPPQVLLDNKAAWDAALASAPSGADKIRYRHEDIKDTLLNETAHKCAYCESKIGHNCPGDIEHKVPKALRPDLTFDWSNMTIACTECNRRKGDYYVIDCMFLDPNTDDVESMIMHVGPFVFSVPGNPRSEVTTEKLELRQLDGRRELIARKLECLEAIRHLAERIKTTPLPALKQILLDELMAHCERNAEYSGMVKAFVQGLPAKWQDN